MKHLLKVLLTIETMTLAASACRTMSHSTADVQTHNVERHRETKTDTVSEHKADSVFVLVDRGDSVVHIFQKEYHTRERVKVLRDTVVVYARNDTIVKKEVVRDKTTRSPPHWKLYLALGLLTIALLAVIFLTIKKHLKL